MNAKKMLLIVNPVAGRMAVGSHLLDIIDIFIKADYDVTVRVTQSGEDTEKVIHVDGALYDTVVCCGGDGTLSLAAGAALEAGLSIPLGYIPGGTVNDFATTRGIPKAPLEAAKRIAEGHTERIDLGFFGSRPFVYVAAFGLFTEASYQTPRSLKNALGRLAYLLEGAKSLGHIRSYPMHFTWDSGEVEGDFVYGMMTNSRTIGGFALAINDDAELDDGLMEVTLIRMPKNAAERQGLLNALITQRADDKHIVHFQTNRIAFQSPEPIAFTVDGEFGGAPQNGEIRLEHGALHIFC